MEHRDFDISKFVKDIAKRQNESKKENKKSLRTPEDSPAQKYNKRYRELWQNRIVWRNNDS